jgi:hypothetical protein
MRKNSILLLLALACTASYLGCGKDDPAPAPNPCAGVTVTVTGTATNATTGQSNGSITATATGGTGFTFSINGGAYVASGTFNNLAAGNYTISAKNSNGCTGSQQITVGTNVPNVCSGVNIAVAAATTTATPCVNPNGTITVTASGSNNFTYSINGTTFQASNVFGSLAAGNYTVTAKDANGCSGSAPFSVGQTAAGPLFGAVRTVVQANCAVSGCHTGANPAGGLNFSVDCNIVSNAALIKTKAVDNAGTASQMPPPPSPALSVADRQKITNWVAAGGGYAN